jgi:type I restriction enzyme S subunit
MSINNVKKLGDVFILQRGFDITKKEQSEGIYPVISSSGVNSFHNKYKVKGPGVVIGRKGTLGTAFYVDGEYWPHDTSLWIKDFKGNNPKFIYYFLTELPLKKLDSGSANPTLNRNFVHLLEAYIPSLDQQTKIAKILSKIDQKIDLNNKINTELESMAKLIYDYWFVQFDFPDANGKPYKSSGGKMVYNEELKREIPDGWNVNAINDVISVKDGTHESPKSSVEGYHLITSKNLKVTGLDFENSNLISKDDYENINKRSKVDTGDILFSMIGSIGAIYKVDEDEINFAIKNVALYKTSQKEECRNFIYMYLKSYDMQRYMGNMISGSIQKFIGLGALRNMPILIDDCTIDRYTKTTEYLFKKLTLIKRENQKLSGLRDWLLPMLMNGQVTVKDANG